MEPEPQQFIFAIGCFTLAFFVVYVLLSWLIKKFTSKKTDNVSPEYVTAEKYHNDIKALKRRIEKLENAIAEKGEQPHRNTVSVKRNDADNDRKPAMSALMSNRNEAEKATSGHQSKTLYLPTPSQDGVFYEAFSEPRVGRTVYQMTTIDDHHGTFSFYENRDALATALISISQIVKTVCRVENNKSNPRSIINVSVGQVVREGSAWKVTEKATVRFE